MVAGGCGLEWPRGCRRNYSAAGDASGAAAAHLPAVAPLGSLDRLGARLRKAARTRRRLRIPGLLPAMLMTHRMVLSVSLIENIHPSPQASRIHR